MQCSNCGNTLLPEDEFCPECGQEVKKNNVEDASLRDENRSFRDESSYDEDRSFREDESFDDDLGYRDEKSYDYERSSRNASSHDDVNDFGEQERTERRDSSGGANDGPSAQEKISQTMKNIQSSDFFKDTVDFLKVSLLSPASLVKSAHDRQIKVPLIVIASLLLLVSLFTFISLRIGTSGLSEYYGSSVIPFSVFFNLFLILVGAFAIFFVLLFLMNQFFLKERVSLIKLAHDYLALSVSVIVIWILGFLSILITLVEVGAFAFLLGVTVLMFIPLYMFMVHLRDDNGKFDTFHKVLIYGVLSVVAYLIIIRLLVGQMLGPAFIEFF